MVSCCQVRMIVSVLHCLQHAGNTAAPCTFTNPSKSVVIIVFSDAPSTVCTKLAEAFHTTKHVSNSTCHSTQQGERGAQHYWDPGSIGAGGLLRSTAASAHSTPTLA
jgi:hypothetical protein